METATKPETPVGGGRFLDDVTLGEVTYRQGRGLESSSGRELVRDLAVTRVVQSAVVDRCSRVAGGAVRHHAHSENPRRYRITEAVLLVSITGVPALITRACTVSSRLTREAIPMPAVAVAATRATITIFKWVMRSAL